MKSNFARVASLVIAAIVLSACSTIFPNQPDRLMLGLSPTNELGYEVDSSGIIKVKSRDLVLSTKAGMPMTNVTGYRIDYYDELNVLVGAGGDDPQALNITVPAGLVCDNPVPGVGCTNFSENARPGNGLAVEVPGLGSALLNADIAYAHVAAGFPSGWYAVLTLYYENARGTFQQEYVLYIAVPN